MKEDISMQRAVVFLSAFIGGAATFLPWVIIPVAGSKYGTSGDGWISFPMFLIVAIMYLTGDWTREIEGWRQIVSVVLGTCAVSLSFMNLWILLLAKLQPDENEFVESFKQGTTAGPGLYLVLLAGFSIIICTLLLGERQRKARAEP